MRLALIAFLLMPCAVTHAAELGGCAIDFGVGPDKYFVATATTTRMILELRKYAGDQLLHDVVIMSRYMVPEYEADDVAFDETPEVIVRTKGGGTGISETHLEVFGVVADKIVRFGDFVIERSVVEDFIRPGREKTYRERLSGNVSFPEKNSLIYRFTRTVTEHGKTVTRTAVEKFIFDSKTMKYKRTKEPEQVVPPDRR